MPTLKRRWYQFSLLALFVATAIVAGIAWSIPLVIDRLSGWPKPIAEFEIFNFSKETIRDLQAISADGTVLYDSNGRWKSMENNIGGGRSWENPGERPRLGRNITVRWTDAKGARRTSMMRIRELEANSGITIAIGPDGRVGGYSEIPHDGMTTSKIESQ